MLDILKKLDNIESKKSLTESTLTECPPEMGMAAPSSGPASLNISAGSASEMAQILKALMSIDHGSSGPVIDMNPEYEGTVGGIAGAALGGAMGGIPGAIAGGAIGDKLSGDEKAVEDWDNTPEEEYRDHKYMTKDLSGGINRQKKMYKPAAKGDNPMAVESIKDRLYRALNEKKAAKDFDGDGKVEKSSDEWKGSRDKAIKKAMGKKTNEGITNWRGDDVDPQIGDMVELYASYDDGTPIRGKIVGPGKRGPKTFAIKFKNMLGKVVVDTFSAVDEFEVIKKATNEAKKAKPDFLDMDKDGNKKEPMKKAVADKKKNPFKK